MQINLLKKKQLTMNNVEHKIDELEIGHEFVSEVTKCLLQTIIFHRALSKTKLMESELRKFNIRYVSEKNLN